VISIYIWLGKFICRPMIYLVTFPLQWLAKWTQLSPEKFPFNGICKFDFKLILFIWRTKTNKKILSKNKLFTIIDILEGKLRAMLKSLTQLLQWKITEKISKEKNKSKLKLKIILNSRKTPFQRKISAKK